MEDYKEMYLKMVRETEKAIHILVAAQQECEELYIAQAPVTAGTEAADASPERGILQNTR